jgi:hypothetical protein
MAILDKNPDFGDWESLRKFKIKSIFSHMAYEGRQSSKRNPRHSWGFLKIKIFFIFG